MFWPDLQGHTAGSEICAYAAGNQYNSEYRVKR